MIRHETSTMIPIRWAVCSLLLSSSMATAQTGESPEQDIPDAIVQKVDPSVVAIKHENAVGSGFIFSKDGYILTNNHVVGDADEAWVRTTRGPQLPATLIRSNPRLDIALLRIEGRQHPCSEVREATADLEVGKGVFGIKVRPGTNARIGFGNPVQAGLNQLFRSDQAFGNLPSGFTGC